MLQLLLLHMLCNRTLHLQCHVYVLLWNCQLTLFQHFPEYSTLAIAHTASDLYLNPWI